MALTQISTKGIKDGTITGADLATNVDLVDNQKIRFGTGNDLEIFHNNSNQSIIKNDNSYLRILSDGVTINNNADSEAMIVAIANGAAELYHDGTKKFETTSAGIKVQSASFATLEVRATGASDGVLKLVANNDENTDWTIRNDYSESNDLDIRFDNARKMNLDTSGNLFISGNLDLEDNDKLLLGAGDDLQIYHDGATSYIKDTGTGNLRLATSKGEFRNAADTENLAAFIENGGVELYYDNSKKFETKSDGVLVTGELQATTLDINGNGHIDGTLQLTDDLFLGDNDEINVGSSNDLKIYHDGSFNYILSPNSHPLIQESDEIQLRAVNNEKYFKGVVNGGVELYYDNSKKFETISDGVEINGGSNTQIRLRKASTGNFTAIKLDRDASGTAGGQLGISGASGHFVTTSSQHDIILRSEANLLFGIGQSEKIRLDSSGNLLIGMTSASTTTQGMMFRPGNESSIFRTSGINLLIGGGQSGQKLVEFRHNGTAIGNISKNGTTEVLYNTSNSDRTLKKNFEDWTDSYWTGFKNLKPQKFNYLFQEDSEPKLKGYIAQDLASIFPEAYPKDVETDKYMFNPSGMVSYLMKTLQEAIIKIETLETEVAALKAG